MVKKSVNKRILSFLMVVMMILSVPAASFAAVPEKPNVSIAITNITGNPDTLELSIVVPAGGNFKAAGAVFEFDTTKLEPITWTSGTAISLAEAADASQGWDGASVIESINPDYLSGKPAMAYKNGTTGYLYMGSEAAKAQTFSKDEKIVTVRFGYVNSTTFADVQTSQAIKFAQDDKVTYASPVKGKMLYQTENRETGEYKFYYLDPVTSTDGGSNVVPDDSITSEENLFPDGDPSTGNGGFVEVPDGETVNTGTANSSDFASLTFYDWDNTLLGTRIVKKGDSLIDPNTTDGKVTLANWKTENGLNGDEADFDAKLAEAGFAPIAPEGNLLTGGTDTDGKLITAINKEGYSFAGWVDYTTGESSPHGAMSGDASKADRTIDPDTIISISKIEQDYLVKAAYNENGIGSGGLSALRYKVHFSAFENTSEGKATTFTVVRSKTTRRANEGKVFLQIDIRPLERGQTRITVPLEAVDLQTYTFSLPLKNVGLLYESSDAISYQIIDETGLGRTTPANIGARVIDPTS